MELRRSAITGPIGKMYADLWPRIASVPKDVVFRKVTKSFKSIAPKVSISWAPTVSLLLLVLRCLPPKTNLYKALAATSPSLSIFRLHSEWAWAAARAATGAPPCPRARVSQDQSGWPPKRVRDNGAGGRASGRGIPGFVDPDYDPALDLDRIESNSVRLLDQEQSMIGVVSIDEAIQMADDSELVLAILSPDADPPVLRLFDSNDYKKHKFEQQKKKRVQQKRSLANRVDIKEVKMGYNIDSHDYSVRLRAAKKFLNDGDKVKVIVNLKRRENEFKDKAIELLKQFQNDVGELASEESKNFSIRDIFMVLVPNKAVIKKSQEQPKKKEEPIKEAPAKEVSAASQSPFSVLVQHSNN
ncbi:uncharacterized protein LOC109842046 [Asparagus officinalis]|uniref:uncharacterized protein LOC109842046 n=1 Tax=Asparagus officinalis TaxID=4686 RepID=UPI00098DEE58|nr:uncharacterized protein LOC109842046 [Asparagus officinalis]